MIAPYFDPQGFVQQSCFPLILPLVSENDYRKKTSLLLVVGFCLIYSFGWKKPTSQSQNGVDVQFESNHMPNVCNTSYIYIYNLDACFFWTLPFSFLLLMWLGIIHPRVITHGLWSHPKRFIKQVLGVRTPSASKLQTGGGLKQDQSRGKKGFIGKNMEYNRDIVEYNRDILGFPIPQLTWRPCQKSDEDF